MPRPYSQRLLASLLSGLLAAGATPFTMAVVHADEPVRLLVVHFRPIQGQVSDAMAPKIEEILGDELHNHDELQVAAAPAPAPAPAPTVAPAAAAPEGAGSGAVDRIEQGEALVKHFKFKPGADTLTAAIGDYEELPAQVDVKVLREAYTQLALAQLRTGANEAGMDSLAAVIRLAPDLPLGGGYPPPFKRAFEQQKRKLTGSPRSSVNVKGEGQIFLDSREQAAAPTTIDEVIAGSHFLRVQRADGSVWGLKLIVGDGENAVTIPDSGDLKKKPAAVSAVPAGPSGPFAGIAQNTIDDGLLGEIAQAGTDANAAFVLFGGLYKGPDGNVVLAPHLYSAKAHGEVALDVASFDPDLVSAGIVTNKLVGKILEEVKTFDTPEDLPAPVAALRKPAKPTPIIVAVAPTIAPTPVVKPVPPPHPVVAPQPDDGEGAKPEPKPTTRILTAQPVDKGNEAEPVGGLHGTAKSSGDDDSGSNVVLYGVLGVGAAVVIAAVIVSIVVVKNNSTPVTGSASLSFQ